MSLGGRPRISQIILEVHSSALKCVLNCVNDGCTLTRVTQPRTFKTPSRDSLPYQLLPRAVYFKMFKWATHGYWMTLLITSNTEKVTNRAMNEGNLVRGLFMSSCLSTQDEFFCYPKPTTLRLLECVEDGDLRAESLPLLFSGPTSKIAFIRERACNQFCVAPSGRERRIPHPKPTWRRLEDRSPTPTRWN